MLNCVLLTLRLILTISLSKVAMDSESRVISILVRSISSSIPEMSVPL